MQSLVGWQTLAIKIEKHANSHKNYIRYLVTKTLPVVSFLSTNRQPPKNIFTQNCLRFQNREIITYFDTFGHIKTL